MNSIPKIEKPKITDLPRIHDRMTFIYLEHCKISRDGSSIVSKTIDGTVNIPAATISVILLGPGTDITHRAIELMGDMGISIVWVGEHGVKYYAHGRALTSHSYLLAKQAQMASNEKYHIKVARAMYQLRFPNEDVSKLSMQQLRGREGNQMRTLYKEQAKKWNVDWNGREYIPNNFSFSNPVNQSLSIGNACLYGLAHAVICALGCSPGLGFVHVNHELSFVYDIADLYKAEITIPIAFELASTQCDDIGSVTRHRIRDELKNGHILNRMVHDIKFLLSDENWDESAYHDTIYLWDNIQDKVKHGISYTESGDIS